MRRDTFREMVARLGAKVGGLCVGGLAVCVTYRLANSTIQTWAERNKYSDQRIAERLERLHKVNLENACVQREKADGMFNIGCNAS